MKAAIIPPILELDTFEYADGIHLVLAHLLHLPQYRGFYLRRREKGDTLILDNSAHELRHPLQPRTLMIRAKVIGAQEVVVPDSPYDCNTTLTLAGKALDAFTRDSNFWALKPRLMLVPQGSSMDEWRTCLAGLSLRWHRFGRAFPDLAQPTMTIGLPAKYDKLKPGTVRTMIEKFVAPMHEREGVELHLLGLRYPWQLASMAREFPWIRSIDSAKPVTYALRGLVWNPRDPLDAWEHVERPVAYFGSELTKGQRIIARENERVFTSMAHGGHE